MDLKSRALLLLRFHCSLNYRYLETLLLLSISFVNFPFFAERYFCYCCLNFLLPLHSNLIVLTCYYHYFCYALCCYCCCCSSCSWPLRKTLPSSTSVASSISLRASFFQTSGERVSVKNPNSYQLKQFLIEYDAVVAVKKFQKCAEFYCYFWLNSCCCCYYCWGYCCYCCCCCYLLL